MSNHSVIVIATKNEGKVKEFAHELGKLGFTVQSLHQYPAIGDIVEDGETFLDNAKIKAKTAGDILGVPVLADDSGLSVAALDGAPGVYSARYSGEHATDASNNTKLISELSKQSGHSQKELLADESNVLSDAQFICALALYIPQTGQFITAEGFVNGLITDRPHGDGGFGYDPHFYLPQLERGMAELSKEEKNAISHRGEALRKLIPQIKATFIIE